MNTSVGLYIASLPLALRVRLFPGKATEFQQVFVALVCPIEYARQFREQFIEQANILLVLVRVRFIGELHKLAREVDDG